jgi:hypothetical protein
MSMVYVPGAEAEFALALLRAAAALRIFHAVYGDARLANQIGAVLLAGRELPIPPPTNNPDGWEGYRGIFLDLLRACGGAVGSALLQPPSDAPAWHPDEATAFLEAIPDVSSATPALRDVLAALE